MAARGAARVGCEVGADGMAHGLANAPYDRVWSDGYRSWCGRRSSDHTLACWGEWYR